MDNTFLIKKHNQHHLGLWLTHLCFFWSGRPFPHPLWWLYLGFNIIPINPRLISCYDVLKKVFTTICIGKQFLTDFNTVIFLIVSQQARHNCNIFTKFAAKFHTHTHTHCSSSSFIVTLSLIHWTDSAHAQFSGCSPTTNVLCKTGQVAICSQKLMLGVLSSRSTLSVLVGCYL